ncbi:MAG: aldo/keto reductase [Cellulophaga sp.]|nr:aldo/keto reductase [Cellulophaga sp.]
MKNNTNYSKIIAGTMTWGSWGKKLSTTQMIALLEHCLSLGITTFDHADIYGDYTNEADFGKAFQESKVDRTKVQLISKCGIQMTSGRNNKVAHYQYDKEYIIWSVEQSLLKLKTEYLDLLLLHRPSPLMQPDEIAEAISNLTASGKIKQFGVSNFTPSQIALLETVIPVSGNQVEFSLTANDVMNNGTLDDCMVNKRMVMSWSVLGSYFKENTSQTERIKKVLKDFVVKYKATEAQLLLAWVLKHPAHIFPVVGTTSPERLTSFSEALTVDLELQDWFILLEASKGCKVD